MRILTAAILGASLLSASVALAQPAAPAGPPPTYMALTSTSFTDGGVIPDKYTGRVSAPISPQLSWTNAPAGTVSFAMILHDPDGAPRKSSGDVLHWMLFNIPATVTSLSEGQPNVPGLPDGTVQANALNRKPGFMAPAAKGDVYHHYTFELFALDTKLDLATDATRDAVLKAMDGHVIGKAALEGRSHL